MTFEEARKRNQHDVFCTADINAHEELYKLEINEDNFWSYNWDDGSVTNPMLDAAIYYSVQEIIENG